MDQIQEDLSGASRQIWTSPEQKLQLKRLRQQAYDRKRKLKVDEFQATKTTEPDIFQSIAKEEPVMNTVRSIPLPPIQEPVSVLPVATDSPVTFWQGVIRGLARIDGEKFIVALPQVLGLSVAAVLVTGLLWQQSTELYRASGFTQPGLIAAGGIMMIIGFAAYYSLSRSWLALLLCLYVGGYEVYFVVSGTIQDERIIQEDVAAENPELLFLKEKRQKSKEEYIALKDRFDDPSSDVHLNAWFRKKHLEPAWALYSAAQNELKAKSTFIGTESAYQSLAWVKVLYRIGLILLCMTIFHGSTRLLMEKH
jgi:hypothetical protein